MLRPLTRTDARDLKQPIADRLQATAFVRPQGLAGHRVAVPFAAAVCAALLGLLFLIDLRKPFAGSVGGLSLLPVMAAAWLLAAPWMAAVAAAAVLLRAGLLVLRVLDPATGLAQIIAILAAAAVARVAAVSRIAEAASLQAALGRKRVEEARERGARALLDVADHLQEAADLPVFFGRLTRTVAEVVQAQKAAFGLYDAGARAIILQPQAFGFRGEALARVRVPCDPAGNGLAERIVFKDLVLRSDISADPEFAPYREVLEAVQASNAIAVAWRAARKPLGIVIAFDSIRPDGFTEEDTWVLAIAGQAAGLVWEFKQAEDRGRQYAQRLTELERAKSEFLSLASHELRSPLGVLQGYLSLMEDGMLGELPAATQSALPTLTGKVREMDELIDQILQTARLEEGRVELHFEQIDLRAAVQTAARSVRPLATPAHRLQVDGPDYDVAIMADPNRLNLILTNLIGNAIKYSPQGGEIRCSVTAVAGFARATIQDRGVGIAPEEMWRLFKRFGRVTSPATREIRGTGLGLYLARELARMQGGDISVESQPGAGSRFTLAFPQVE